MKQSETRTIKRSQIRLNPINPKRHSDEQVKQQKKNLKKVGYLGGVVWNASTGNLIDGHRRIKALDAINKYDGTNDYDIKVEMVEFDEKTEKEQLTYMALGNSKADYNLVAEYVDTIDYENVGISEAEYSEILKLKPTDKVETIEAWDDDFIAPVTELHVEEKSSDEIVKEHKDKPKMTKEQVKAEKRYCDDVAMARQDDRDTYIVMNFRDYEQKRVFCELIGVLPTNNMMLGGETIDNLLGMIE